MKTSILVGLFIYFTMQLIFLMFADNNYKRGLNEASIIMSKNIGKK